MSDDLGLQGFEKVPKRAFGPNKGSFEWINKPCVSVTKGGITLNKVLSQLIGVEKNVEIYVNVKENQLLLKAIKNGKVSRDSYCVQTNDDTKIQTLNISTALKRFGETIVGKRYIAKMIQEDAVVITFDKSSIVK